MIGGLKVIVHRAPLLHVIPKTKSYHHGKGLLWHGLVKMMRLFELLDPSEEM